MSKWTEIERAATAENGEACLAVMAAWENAATTVYEEKTVPEDQIEAVALSSLQGLLADGCYAAAVPFFTSIGVRF